MLKASEQRLALALRSGANLALGLGSDHRQSFVGMSERSWCWVTNQTNSNLTSKIGSNIIHPEEWPSGVGESQPSY